MSKEGEKKLTWQLADQSDPYGVNSLAARPGREGSDDNTSENSVTKRSVENTTRRAQENPMSVLADAMLFGSSNAIERSEAEGQRQLLQSTVLPVEGSENPKLAELGFTFGDAVPGDELFRDATLPKGWKREGSDHAMWSYIVDERSIKRVAVFYKAAFYDRRADMRVANVGNDLATNALYGDADITPESLRLSLLTPDELKEFASALDCMAARIKDSPDIYSKYRERLKACRATLGTRAPAGEP